MSYKGMRNRWGYRFMTWDLWGLSQTYEEFRWEYREVPRDLTYCHNCFTTTNNLIIHSNIQRMWFLKAGRSFRCSKGPGHGLDLA